MFGKFGNFYAFNWDVPFHKVLRFIDTLNQNYNVKMNFGDLKEDTLIQEKLTNFHDSIEKIDHMLDMALNSDIYDKLSLKEKVDYDLFIAYTLNTLYWLYLRSINEDPNKNDVKNQLGRIKDYMVKAKQAHERQTIRPRIDQQAASRFVKHGIQHKREQSVQQPPNKKLKVSDWESIPID